VFPVTQGAAFLGYRIFPTHRLLRRENVRRFQKRLKVLQSQFSSGIITVENVGQSVQSWIAHASHADTYGLRRKVLSGAPFQRG
jgi:RNA-directed DNA polymerase